MKISNRNLLIVVALAIIALLVIPNLQLTLVGPYPGKITVLGVDGTLTNIYRDSTSPSSFSDRSGTASYYSYQYVNIQAQTHMDYTGGIWPIAWNAYGDIKLSGTMKIESSVTDMLPAAYVGEWRKTYVTGGGEETTNYVNKSYKVWSYVFAINTRIIFIDDPRVTYSDVHEAGGITTDGMVKDALPGLIAQYNAYAQASSTYYYFIDAPRTAGGELAGTEYQGILGMWLIMYTSSVADDIYADMSPIMIGQPVTFYSDAELATPVWTVAGDVSRAGIYDPATLTDSVVVNPDYFMAPYGWMRTNVNSMGVKLIYDTAKSFPNYIRVASEDGVDIVERSSSGTRTVERNTNLPAVKQWIRLDIAGTWDEPFSIPNYDAPEEVIDATDIRLVPTPEGTSYTTTNISVWPDLGWLPWLLGLGLVAFIVYRVMRRSGGGLLPRWKY